MLESIRKTVAGRSVLILGFGREGKSTYKIVREAGGYRELAVADQAPRDPSLEPEIRWYTGADYQKAMDSYDLVWKSPGIVLQQGPQAHSCRITSQTQEFFSRYRNQIIGVTGTKGKSTTTTLIYHILKENGVKCLLAGNIGIPAFDVAEQAEPDTVIVFELSSHQLEYMTVSPRTAVLLNIHEEHLDHYGTMEKYVAAKKNIYLHQKETDLFFCNEENLPAAEENHGRLIPVGGRDCALWLDESRGEVHFDGEVYRIPTEQIRLVGTHNWFDIAVAYGVCRRNGITDQGFTRALESYQPLPHRLQYIGCRNGVKYYDDSISTICNTTLQAIRSVKDADTVLVGGMDRGIDYTELMEGLLDFPRLKVIFMEASGARVYREMTERYGSSCGPQRLFLVKNLEEAVTLAAKITAPGHSCLLSPAAASYGIFKNFEERGEVFQQLVKELR